MDDMVVVASGQPEAVSSCYLYHPLGSGTLPNSNVKGPDVAFAEVALGSCSKFFIRQQAITVV